MHRALVLVRGRCARLSLNSSISQRCLATNSFKGRKPLKKHNRSVPITPPTTPAAPPIPSNATLSHIVMYANPPKYERQGTGADDISMLVKLCALAPDSNEQYVRDFKVYASGPIKDFVAEIGKIGNIGAENVKFNTAKGEIGLDHSVASIINAGPIWVTASGSRIDLNGGLPVGDGENMGKVWRTYQLRAILFILMFLTAALFYNKVTGETEQEREQRRLLMMKKDKETEAAMSGGLFNAFADALNEDSDRSWWQKFNRSVGNLSGPVRPPQSKEEEQKAGAQDALADNPKPDWK